MLCIRNGTLVSGSRQWKSDILVENGRISAVGEGLECPGAQVIDARGCYVFPGFIDAHTHLDMECAAGVTADDFATGTGAALAGGTTTILDFATQENGEPLADALAHWHKKADGVSRCNYGFHMAITQWSEDIPRQMEQMCKAGVTSFKVYLAYDNLRLTDEQVEQVLACAARLGAVVGAHCEDGDAVNRGVAAQKAAGNLSPAAHPLSRPNRVEAAAVRRFLEMARKTGALAYVVHLSTREGLEEIRAARAAGQTVFAETCPQYLAFTDRVYRLDGFEGAKFVCSPPIRSAEDRDALWQAVLDGEIDTIATDHCSFRFADQKRLGENDFSLIPNGLPGIEHRPEAMYTLGCVLKGMPVTRLCAMLSENPARIYGMYPRKGSLEVGADADLVIWDPAAAHTITAAAQHQNTDYTPFEGMQMAGKARTVLLNGAVAWQSGTFSPGAEGKFVERAVHGENLPQNAQKNQKNP